MNNKDLLISVSARLARDMCLKKEKKTWLNTLTDAKNRAALLDDLKAIGNSGDLETIIASEKYFTLFERREFPRDADKQAAVDDLNAIEEGVKRLADT